MFWEMFCGVLVLACVLAPSEMWLSFLCDVGLFLQWFGGGLADHVQCSKWSGGCWIL